MAASAPRLPRLRTVALSGYDDFLLSPSLGKAVFAALSADGNGRLELHFGAVPAAEMERVACSTVKGPVEEQEVEEEAGGGSKRKRKTNKKKATARAVAVHWAAGGLPEAVRGRVHVTAAPLAVADLFDFEEEEE